MTAQQKSSEKKTSSPPTKEIMIVNDDPGIETRIAIVENGRLEELYTERTKAATGVGNIYKARVNNVEAAVQAAFIDYGGAQRGFLHVTDLHPKYFPGNTTSERVGKKIARHARPPIQSCLRRGDEILVQVLKEGIGTKGPTLTSYLSIPGRLSVMMPYMDNVGVSRKIEDEDERKKMRKVLDAINLPSGFGFILRTAGMGKKVAEVKRDVAYLIRLWKMIEKRNDKVGAPCPLYNESDLLIRTIRDILRPSIDTIVVDSDSAYERISSFLKIAAPRSVRKIIRSRETAPIFHVFDIERQIEEIHGSKVLLPSGGSLVINQTEALVAIDVNSGKSRGAKNSEENAFLTNLEAADEICRQLRLRDLGGIVVNDLIDMGSPTHRRKIEQRFQTNLERDRARSSVLPISRFGLIEMTRQRIRPSVLDSHYVTCVHCDGRGHVKTPEEVAADATRYCGWLLHLDKVKRVELVCSASVGSYLLSNRRQELNNYEQELGKRLVVRISEEFATDQVVHYAYDERGSDLDIEKFPLPAPPTIDSIIKKEKSYTDHSDTNDETHQRKRGSRRRGRRNLPLADGSSFTDSRDLEEELASLDKPEKVTKEKVRPEKVIKEKVGPKKSIPKKSTPAESAMRVYQFARSIRKTSQEVIELCKSKNIPLSNHMSTMSEDVITTVQELLEGSKDSVEKPKRRRRRRGSRRKSTSAETVKSEEPSGEQVSVKQEKASSEETKDSASSGASKKKRSRRSKRQRKTAVASTEKTEKPVKKVASRRTLYGGRHRPVSSDEVHANMDDR